MHWYDFQGNPHHTYTNKKGEVKDTTLREARKHGWVPSVSAITGIPNAPALNSWKEDRIIDATMDLVAVTEEAPITYKSIKDLAGKIAKDAASEGTRIHDVVCQYFSRNVVPENSDDCKIVYAIQELFDKEFGVQKWHNEQSFASPLGYGGQIDRWCDVAIVDYKSKDMAEGDIVKGWPNQAEQLAAYRHGIGKPSLPMYNIFISRNVPGLVRLYKHEDDTAFERFECLLRYWQLSKNYFPEVINK